MRVDGIVRGSRKCRTTLFRVSPLARAIALSLSLSACRHPTHLTGTAGRRAGGAAGASASQPPRSLSLSAGRPPSLRLHPPPPPIKTNKPLSSHPAPPVEPIHHHQNASPAIKANLEPPTREPLVIEHDQLTRNPKVDSRQQQSRRRHRNNLCTSFCEKHRTTTLLSFSLTPYLFLCSPSSVLLAA